jgi:hypothetical protein
MVQSGLVLFGLVCGVLLNSCKLLQAPGRSCSDRTRRRPVNTHCMYRPSFRVAPTLQWSFSTGNFRRVPAVILPMQLFSCALLACRYRRYRVYVNFKYNFQHPLFKIRRSSKRPLYSCGPIKREILFYFLFHNGNFVIKTKTNLFARVLNLRYSSNILPLVKESLGPTMACKVTVNHCFLPTCNILLEFFPNLSIQ